ncbi:MAG: hypothetical protein HY957_01995 [Nitrospirae bacterium]|nr:hypothetical protein [Nitrospirota bacterium]
MATIWDIIGIKKGPGGVGDVTVEQKNSTISDAVSKWTEMGLSQEQIAFGIATMGVESGFNSTAQAKTTTAYGLGQFTNDAWKRAVKYYNENYGGNLNSDQSRNDPAAQIAVMGAWTAKVWTMTQSVANDPRLKGYSLSEIAYGMWHEGFGTEGNVNGVRRYLQGSKYNNSNIKGYFVTTYQSAGNILGGYYTENACFSTPQASLLDGIFNPTFRLFTTSLGTTAIPTRRDPAIVDLDGDGIETTNVKDGAYFDHDGNGFAEQTGWAASDDGMLAMDRNGDGIINDGKELFGDQTLLANGTKAANAFEALREQDSNADGKIDANDTAFNQIKVWQDVDGDGYSTADELKSLSDVGIKSINLNSTPSTTTDSQGNTQTRTGSFEKTDGTTGTIGEYNLQRDTAYTIANEWLDVPDDIAALPDLQGYGNVYDLQQAMAREAISGQQSAISLKTLVEQFSAATDTSVRNSLMEQILYKWTGSEGIDPNSRGSNIDARKLAVLEKLFGQAFVSQYGTNPITEAATLLKDAYRGLSEMMYSQLMAQTHLKDLYGAISYTWDDATQSVKADMSAVISELQNNLSTDSETGKTLLGEFARTIRGFGAQEIMKSLFFTLLIVAFVRNRNLRIDLKMEV